MTARKPCGEWREVIGGSVLLGGAGIPPMRVYQAAADLRWYWYGADLDPHPADGKEAAQLAAEDAARDLLLGGLATLAPGMPEGFAIEWDNPDKWAHAFLVTEDEFGKPRRIHLGDSAELRAVALGMLAVVRSKP